MDHDHVTPGVERLLTAPAEFVDSDHPDVGAMAARLTEGVRDDAARAKRIFEFVREVPYVGEDFEDLETYRASSVLARGRGYCVSKASLFAALARAAGLPTAVAFADVRNHLASPQLLEAMGTDTFAWHGYAEVRVEGRWLAVSPTFDTPTCRRAGVPPIEFDGRHDAILQRFDGGGEMEYVVRHGTFHDVPARFLAREMVRLYPFAAAGGLRRFNQRQIAR